MDNQNLCVGCWVTSKICRIISFVTICKLIMNTIKQFLLFSYLFLNLHMVLFLNLNLFFLKMWQMTSFVYISKNCEFCTWKLILSTGYSDFGELLEILHTSAVWSLRMVKKKKKKVGKFLRKIMAMVLLP